MSRKLGLLLMLWAMLLPACAARGQDLTGLYLTWHNDPTTTMTINWVDIYPKGTLSVFYRPADSEDEFVEATAEHKAIDPSALQRRWVELRDLKPDTMYQFGIGKKPEKPTDGWRFRTMPATLDRPVRFVTGGDMMHSRELLDPMNKRAAALDPDFALLVGDLAYEDGVRATRIMDWLSSWRTLAITSDRRLIPMVLGIGNHEVRGGYNGKIPDDAPYFYGLFTLPGDRAFYALDIGNYLSLVLLDSGHTNKVDGEQAQWLEQTLAARTDRQFLYVGYHYPAYGTTKAPENGLPIDNPRATVIQQHWVPIFDRFNPSVIFENDHHNYKRSVRLRGHKPDPEHGLLYVGDGAWGVRTREVPKPEVAWWLAKAEPRNHLWFVEIRSDGTSTLQAIDAAGEVFDEVQIAQPRPTPPASPDR